jgi:pyruvate kinase
VAFTTTGATALRIARQRPECGVLGLTTSTETARRLALVWGVHPIVSEGTFTMGETVARATTLASRTGMAKRGEEIVVVAGVPFGRSGGTNSLRVARVGQAPAD